QIELCRSIREILLTSSVIILCRADDVYAIGNELKHDKSLEKLTFLQKIPEKYSPEKNFR
ncbi:MAG: hypothetical protein K2H26_07460, partial [Ruminococcus sp.]|nr:hypothetical protein [Ruminococcus sp.]